MGSVSDVLVLIIRASSDVAGTATQIAYRQGRELRNACDMDDFSR
jgi:hypothetical protein